MSPNQTPSSRFASRSVGVFKRYRIENRINPRVGADFPAELQLADGSEPIAARTRDLGVGGVCVMTPDAFETKAIESVVLGLPDGPLVLRAHCRWQRLAASEGVVLTGIEFADCRDAALDRLWDVVVRAGKDLARFLHYDSVLTGLGVEAAMGLAQVSRFRAVPAGACIYTAGAVDAAGASVYLLHHGEMVLELPGPEGTARSRMRLEPGALFGGLPLLAETPPVESAVAASDARLIEIDRSSWEYLQHAKPWLAQELGRALLRVHALRLHAILADLAGSPA